MSLATYIANRDGVNVDDARQLDFEMRVDDAYRMCDGRNRLSKQTRDEIEELWHAYDEASEYDDSIDIELAARDCVGIVEIDDCGNVWITDRNDPDFRCASQGRFSIEESEAVELIRWLKAS